MADPGFDYEGVTFSTVGFGRGGYLIFDFKCLTVVVEVIYLEHVWTICMIFLCSPKGEL